MADTDLASWLEGVQRGVGITYEDNHAEQRAREAFSHLRVGGGFTLIGPVNAAYSGYVERVLPDGTRQRTGLYICRANIRLGDGSSFYLELTGPYGGSES